MNLLNTKKIYREKSIVCMEIEKKVYLQGQIIFTKELFL